MNKRILGLVALSGGLLAGGLAQAHHSLAATYDVRGQGEVTGVLTEVRFTNPHGAMKLEVDNGDGTTTLWEMTTGSANTLASLGFGDDGPNNVEPGDVLTISYYPSRNGSPLGFIRSITFEDERQVEFEIE